MSHQKLSKQDDDEIDTPKACFLYDIESKPNCIEKVFGELHHVKDEYKQHQISMGFILTVISVYMVQGARDALNIAFFYYFQAVFNLGPSELQRFQSYISIPWTIKILYGLMVDALPICGYKRKPYILFFGILGPLTVILTITYGHNSYNVQLIFMIINSICTAFCDVIADALTIERTEFKSHSVATRLQSLAWGARTISSITTILIGTNLQKSGAPDDILKVYWLYFAISLLIPLFAIFLPENRLTSDKNKNIHHSQQALPVKTIFYLSFETLCRKSIFYPVLFIFLMASTPTSTEPLRYFFVNHLGFNPVQIGYLGVVASVSFLIAIGYFAIQSRKSNTNFSIRKQYVVWTIIAAFLPFIILILIFGLNDKIGIPDYAFVISDRILIYTAYMVLFMCSLIIFARICPPGIEGFFMTILTSIANAALAISYAISSGITDSLGIECVEDEENVNEVDCNFSNLWILVIIVNLSTLLPLVFIYKIPDEKEMEVINEKLKDASDEVVDGDKENGKRQLPDRDDMIGLYWFCMERIFLCKCCSETKEFEIVKDKSTAEIEMDELDTFKGNTEP